jgi:hypothetical protein
VTSSYAGGSVTPYFFNFTDLTRSHRVNPLAPKLLATASFTREAAATILTNLDAKAAQQRNSNPEPVRPPACARAAGHRRRAEGGAEAGATHRRVKSTA